MGRKSKDYIRKPQILEHFREVINKEGFQKASRIKVAQSMGVSANLVGHYFDSKEAMVLELYDHLTIGYTELLVSAAEGQKEPEQRIKAMLKIMFGVQKSYQKLLIDNSFYALYYISLNNEAMKIRFNNTYQNHKKFWIKEIQIAMDQGVVSQGNSAKLAELMISLFEGFSFRANLRIKSNHFEEFGQFFYEKAWALLKAAG
jgi:AcrR family transcriptional regulator